METQPLYGPSSVFGNVRSKTDQHIANIIQDIRGSDDENDTDDKATERSGAIPVAARSKFI